MTDILEFEKCIPSITENSIDQVQTFINDAEQSVQSDKSSRDYWQKRNKLVQISTLVANKRREILDSQQTQVLQPNVDLRPAPVTSTTLVPVERTFIQPEQIPQGHWEDPLPLRLTQIPTMQQAASIDQYIANIGEWIRFYNTRLPNQFNRIHQVYKLITYQNGINNEVVRSRSLILSAQSTMITVNASMNIFAAQYFQAVLRQPRIMDNNHKVVMPMVNPKMEFPFTTYLSAKRAREIQIVSKSNIDYYASMFNTTLGTRESFKTITNRTSKAICYAFVNRIANMVLVRFTDIVAAAKTQGVFFMANEVSASDVTTCDDSKISRWSPIITETGMLTGNFIGLFPNYSTMIKHYSNLKMNFAGLLNTKVFVEIVNDNNLVNMTQNFNHTFLSPSEYEAKIDTYCIWTSSHWTQCFDRNVKGGLWRIWPGTTYFKGMTDSGLWGSEIRKLIGYNSEIYQDHKIYRFISDTWLESQPKEEHIPQPTFYQFHRNQYSHLPKAGVIDLITEVQKRSATYTVSHFELREHYFEPSTEPVRQFVPIFPLEFLPSRKVEDTPQYHRIHFVNETDLFPEHFILCGKTTTGQSELRCKQLDTALALYSRMYLHIAICYNFYEPVNVFTVVGYPVAAQAFNPQYPPRRLAIDPITMILAPYKFDQWPQAYRYLYFQGREVYLHPDQVPPYNTYDLNNYDGGYRFYRGSAQRAIPWTHNELFREITQGYRPARIIDITDAMQNPSEDDYDIESIE